MRTKLKLMFIFIISGLILVACSSSKAPTDTTASVASSSNSSAEVSFSKEIWPILQKYALAAHGGKGGVFLENYKDVMKYVVSGKPEESQLYQERNAPNATQRSPFTCNDSALL
jgi:aconitase A